MQFPDLPLADDAPEAPVTFFSEDVPFELAHPQLVSAWLQRVAAQESKMIQEINYIFCTDDFLREVNVQYLQHDYYTDIITFPFDDDADTTDIRGDLFISIDRVEDNARTLKIPFLQELYRVMVHGLLHLVGYGDKTPAEIAQMRERENFHLAHFE
jgi:rRNA maturation RNase YbeY